MGTKRKKRNQTWDHGAPLKPRDIAICTWVAATLLPAALEYLPSPLVVVGVTGGIVGLLTLGLAWFYTKHYRPGCYPHQLAAGGLICWAATAVMTASIAFGVSRDERGLIGWTIAGVVGVIGATASWALLNAADWKDRSKEDAALTIKNVDPATVAAEINLAELQEKHEKWGPAMKRLCKQKFGWEPEVGPVVPWTPKTPGGPVPGITLHLALPKDDPRASFTVFADNALREMEEKIGLDDGCTITTEKAGQAGKIRLNIELINPELLASEHPCDWSPLTINKPLPLVMTPRGDWLDARLRQNGLLVFGVPGSGKSSFLSTLLATFSRCDDVVVWGVDVGKHGLAFADWTYDLPLGVKSVVQRVAATYGEALEMVDALLAAAPARNSAGLLAGKGAGDLPEMSHGTPQIVLIFDEAAEIFAGANSRNPMVVELKAKVESLLRRTRSAGFRTVFTFTDTNLDSIGSTDLVKYNPFHIALVGVDGVAAESAAVSTFGRPKNIDLSSLTATGQGVTNIGAKGGVTLMRNPHLSKDQIIECMVETSGRRAVPTASDLRAFGDMKCRTAYDPDYAEQLAAVDQMAEPDQPEQAGPPQPPSSAEPGFDVFAEPPAESAGKYDRF